MGYLNNSVITVDAILTKKGRELLARGDGSFRISQFALADDEIDYTLYNTAHPSGSAYFGEALENMPLLEAFPDETQSMKYKLATLPRGTAKLPLLEAGFASITLKQGASLTITPQTLNFLGASQAFESSGYTATIADVRLLSNFTGVGVNTAEASRLNQTTTLGTNVSKTVIGTSINISGTTINTLYGSASNTLTSTITLIGRDSGARITIPITITKTN
mgnify:FL=1|jgi:hypothetical protein|tara:strand:- start:2461 stop:3120 length:660 start_codon:yes stop_codon:yes gene_type:complete